MSLKGLHKAFLMPCEGLLNVFKLLIDEKLYFVSDLILKCFEASPGGSGEGQGKGLKAGGEG